MDNLHMSVAAQLIAAGAISLISFVYGRYRHLIRFIAGDNSGVTGCYGKLPTANLETELSAAKSEIAILQTWMDNASILQGSIALAVKEHNARVRILLLHPESPQLAYRAKEFQGGISLQEAKTRLITQLNDLKSYFKSKQIDSHIEIRLYQGTPVISLYRADNIVYIGNFWRGGSAMQCPQIRSKRGGYYEQWARIHFDAIWNDCETSKA